MIEVRRPASCRWLLGLVIVVMVWAGVLGQAHCPTHDVPSPVAVSVVHDGTDHDEPSCSQPDPVALALQPGTGHTMSLLAAIPAPPSAADLAGDAWPPAPGLLAGKRLLVLHGVSRT